MWKSRRCFVFLARLHLLERNSDFAFVVVFSLYYQLFLSVTDSSSPLRVWVTKATSFPNSCMAPPVMRRGALLTGSFFLPLTLSFPVFPQMSLHHRLRQKTLNSHFIKPPSLSKTDSDVQLCPNVGLSGLNTILNCSTLTWLSVKYFLMPYCNIHSS